MSEKTCRHCGKWIRTVLLWAHWVHRDNGSIYCDNSGTVKAAP